MRAHAIWGFVILLAGLAACSGKSRVFADGAGGASTEVDSLLPEPTGAAGASPVDAPGELGPAVNGIPPRSAGASCVTSADCDAPTQCVDGVCCTSACTELCAACNVPGSIGTCSAAPSDEACGTLLCAGFDTECRKLDSTQLSLNCQGFGTCKVNADCAVLAEPNGAACQANSGACDGSGACLVAGKAALGQACATNDECAEGHCVLPAAGGAGICCDAACDGACQACSPAGHCEQTPTTDARCEAVACPPDDVCKDYIADVTASQCRSFGQCQTGRDCPAEALRPEGECECDAASGACLLRGGASCALATECASAVCGANGRGALICCAAACTEGLFCSTDGSGCVACEGSAIECDGNTERRCGAGAIITTECPNGCTAGTGCNGLPPLGFPCDAGQCATPNVCQADVTGAQRCCSRNCAAEGKVCADNGSCVCQPGQVAAGNDCLLQDGDPCSSTAECQAGSTCTDGVCCQEACNGTCESCQSNTGLCVAVPAAQPDASCGAGRQCTGSRGDCRLTVRQPCTGNGAECTTNNCEPTVGNATQICCAAACTPDRPFCRSDGTSCVQCETNADCGNGCNTLTGLCNPLQPLGAQCAVDGQCGSETCELRGPGVGSGTVCCAASCAAGTFCSTDGQRCVECDGSPGGASRCTNGCDVPRGVCNSLAANGQSCGTNANCASQLCENAANGTRLCCFAACQALGEACNDAGNACVCRAGSVRDIDGVCRRLAGETCNADTECVDDVCLAQFVDDDADTFGRANSQPSLICGETLLSGRSFNSGDCCDSDPEAIDQQFGLYHTLPNTCGGYDWNCDGLIELIFGDILTPEDTEQCFDFGCR